MDSLFNLICIMTDFCTRAYILFKQWIKDTWGRLCNKCFRLLYGEYVLAHNIYYAPTYLEENIGCEDIFHKYPIDCFDENNNWKILGRNDKFVYYKNRKSQYKPCVISEFVNNDFQLVCKAPEDATPLEFTQGLKPYHCYSIQNDLIDEGIPTLWLRFCSWFQIGRLWTKI